MANTFLQMAKARPVADVRQFLKEAASGMGIKYAPKGGEKHRLYIPFQTVPVAQEDGTQVTENQVIAISENVHSWTDANGKFRSVVCIKDKIRNCEGSDEQLNDGTCPLCDRVADGWEIYNYRKAIIEATVPAGLTGDPRDKYLRDKLAEVRNARKSVESRPMMYILIVQFRLKAEQPVLDKNGLPEFDLRVMRMSASRAEKFEKQVCNSGVGEFPGSEFIVDYPESEEPMAVVSQSTITATYGPYKITETYPALINEINRQVAEFDFEGLEKAYPEWSGISTSEAKKIMDESFEKWDTYKEELTTNPNAKYLEYLSPASGEGVPINMQNAGQFQQMPGQFQQMPGQFQQMPGQFQQMPGQFQQMPGQFQQMPGQFQQPAQEANAPQIGAPSTVGQPEAQPNPTTQPAASIPDVNQVFADMGGSPSFNAPAPGQKA